MLMENFGSASRSRARGIRHTMEEWSIAPFLKFDGVFLTHLGRSGPTCFALSKSEFRAMVFGPNGLQWPRYFAPGYLFYHCETPRAVPELAECGWKAADCAKWMACRISQPFRCARPRTARVILRHPARKRCSVGGATFTKTSP